MNPATACAAYLAAMAAGQFVFGRGHPGLADAGYLALAAVSWWAGYSARRPSHPPRRAAP